MSRAIDTVLTAIRAETIATTSPDKTERYPSPPIVPDYYNGRAARATPTIQLSLIAAVQS